MVAEAPREGQPGGVAQRDRGVEGNGDGFDLPRGAGGHVDLLAVTGTFGFPAHELVLVGETEGVDEGGFADVGHADEETEVGGGVEGDRGDTGGDETDDGVGGETPGLLRTGEEHVGASVFVVLRNETVDVLVGEVGFVEYDETGFGLDQGVDVRVCGGEGQTRVAHLKDKVDMAHTTLEFLASHVHVAEVPRRAAVGEVQVGFVAHGDAVAALAGFPILPLCFFNVAHKRWVVQVA